MLATAWMGRELEHVVGVGRVFQLLANTAVDRVSLEITTTTDTERAALRGYRRA
jgi:hypothetical protein